MTRRALICGISGQDGAYLAQLLLSKGYEVWGTSRDAQINSFHGLKALEIFNRVNLRSMSPEDFSSVLQVFSDVKPHEIYNLAGQSSVGLSFEQPIETMASIAASTLNQLESIRFVDKSIRFYNAGSSECFGDTGLVAADETTVFHPTSPYAVAKAASSWHVTVYRQSYGLFACTGTLFNHESPLRPERFVTKKIVAAAGRIANGSNETLKLGNMAIRRDWGWAPDYVAAMWKMLNLDEPQDFVIATGETNSLHDFVEAVFSEAGLNFRAHVISDPNLLRPSDPTVSTGNPNKALKLLDWQPTVVGLDVPRTMYRETLAMNLLNVGEIHV
jgi:GDPmannose 4,6-dehydratase